MQGAAGVRTEVHPAELHQLPRAEVGGERLDETLAPEREPQRRAEARHLVERRGDDLLLPPRPVEVGLGRVPEGCGGCGNRRARACRPCAGAAGEAPALHPEHCAEVLYGQSNLFDRIFRGTSTSIPPTASTKLLEAVEVDEDHVVDVEAGEVMTVRSASAGPPIWFAALILASPTSGISTWRSRGIER